MQLNDLSPAPGSRKDRKRVGRGHGSGHGGTSGRATRARTPARVAARAPGSRAARTPLAMRLPKLPGFTNHWRQEFDVVNVRRLDALFADGDVVDADSLKAKGVIKSADAAVKVLGDGEITKKLTVQRRQDIGERLASKIEAAGGTVE